MSVAGRNTTSFAGNAKGAASRASVPPLSTAHTIYRKGEQDNDRLSEQHFRKAGNHQGKRNHTERGALPFADADDTVVPRFNSAGGGGDRLIFIKEDDYEVRVLISGLIQQHRSYDAETNGQINSLALRLCDIAEAMKPGRKKKIPFEP